MWWLTIVISILVAIVLPIILLSRSEKEKKSHVRDEDRLQVVKEMMIFEDDTVRDFKYFIPIVIKFVVICLIALIALYLIFIHEWIFGKKVPTIITWFAWLVLIVTYFVQNGIAADLAYYKGYNQFKGALWGLIPIYGIIKYAMLPKRKNVQASTISNIYSVKSILVRYIIFSELVILGIIVILPIVYLVGAAFAKQSGLPTTFWPHRLTLDNFKLLFDIKKSMFLYWYKNTFVLATLNMIFGVLFITGAAYIFARFKFKGKKIGLISILVLQVFPSFMGMIALFTLYQTFNLVGSSSALTLIYVGGSIPFNLWLIKGYLQQIPRDLDESAMLDGANKAQIFFKIILPLSVPILSFVAVSQFMAPWMDYILPSFLLNILPRNAYIPPDLSPADVVKQQWTLAVGLFGLISGTNTEYTTFGAGALVVALPITVLYMVFQRFLIQGITAGATKG